MAHYNTIFSQILKLVPRHEFETLATQHHCGRSFRNGANYRLLSGIKLYSIEDLGEAGHLYEKIWTELKAR